MAGTTGDRIREGRERLGMTQTDLAASLGVKEANVYRWERGDSQPSHGMFRRIVRALDVSADWLLFGEERAEVESVD